MKYLTPSLSFSQVHGFSATEKIAFVTADKRLVTYFASVPLISSSYSVKMSLVFKLK